MQGGKHESPLGYTIVELMIVLAVSSVMFLIASTFISGRQEKASFYQAIHDMAGQIRSLTEEVTDGQYTDVPFTCTASSGSLSFTAGGGTTGTGTTAGSAVQGTNTDCVFMGKLWHLHDSTDAAKYEVYSLAGTRLDTSGNPATTLLNTNISAIHGAGLDITRNETMPQGLTLSSITETDAATNTPVNFYGFGFVTSFANTDADSRYVSGAQSISMIYASIAPAEDESNVTSATVHYASQVKLCVTDGTQKGSITVGGNSSQLAVDVQIGDSTC